MSGAPGNSFLRMLLVEAAHSVVRLDEGFRKQYAHRCHSKPKGIAKVAAARRLAVRLYWMLRTNTAYPEIVRIENSPRVPLAVSRETVRRLLRAAKLASPQKRRSRQYRSRRLPRPRFGMMALTDASRHDWLEGRGPQLTLIGFQDDATGQI